MLSRVFEGNAIQVDLLRALRRRPPGKQTRRRGELVALGVVRRKQCVQGLVIRFERLDGIDDAVKLLRRGDRQPADCDFGHAVVADDVAEHRVRRKQAAVGGREWRRNPVAAELHQIAVIEAARADEGRETRRRLPLLSREG